MFRLNFYALFFSVTVSLDRLQSRNWKQMCPNQKSHNSKTNLTCELEPVTRRDPLQRLSSYKELCTCDIWHIIKQSSTLSRQWHFFDADFMTLCLQASECEARFRCSVNLNPSLSRQTSSVLGARQHWVEVIVGERSVEMKWNQPYDRAAGWSDWVTCRTATQDQVWSQNEVCKRDGSTEWLFN